MRIEFRTVYDNVENEKLGQVYVKYCMDKQIKQMNTLRIILIVVCVLGFVPGLVAENVSGRFVPYTLFCAFLVFGLIYIQWAKNKLLPKTFTDINGVGCPYNVTFGLYDEYFYEKFENNMSISENSIRYEFLKKVVETPEYFVLMTERTQVLFLPKRDMGYENALEFSLFCKGRLGYIYSFKS